MTKKSCVDTIWHVPDEIWSIIAEILGPEKQPGTVGRPARPHRVIFDRIIYALCTGCHWHKIPRGEYAPDTTIYTELFRRWSRGSTREEGE